MENYVYGALSYNSIGGRNMKTITITDQQKEALFEKHPQLTGIRITEIGDAFPEPDRWGQLEDYIEASWANTYNNLERIQYSKDFLKWSFDSDGPEAQAGVALMFGEETAALVLNSKRTTLYRGKKVRSGIQTCMSVSSLHGASGLGKYLVLAFQAITIREQFDGLFYWLHSSLPNKYSSYKIFSAYDGAYWDHWGDYPLMIRVFDVKRLSRLTHIKSHEIAIMRLFASEPGVPVDRCQAIDENNLEEALEFCNQMAISAGEGRCFSKDEFDSYANYKSSSSDFDVLGIIKRVGGKVRAVAVGYYATMFGKVNDMVFFIDYLCMEEGSNLNTFIREIETMVHERYNVCCLFAIDRRLGFRQRYFPSGTTLACRSVAYTPNFVRRDNRNRPIPIIDMK